MSVRDSQLGCSTMWSPVSKPAALMRSTSATNARKSRLFSLPKSRKDDGVAVTKQLTRAERYSFLRHFSSAGRRESGSVTCNIRAVRKCKSHIDPRKDFGHEVAIGQRLLICFCAMSRSGLD